MATISIRSEDLKNVVLNIGFVGENLHKQVRIDCKKEFDEYPNATPSLTVVPPQGDIYTAAIMRDGTVVIWNIEASDLQSDGDGEIQLKFVEENTVNKTCIGRTHINRSIGTSGGGGGGGTTNYNALNNKPQIGGHELIGNKTAADLGLATPEDIPDVSGLMEAPATPGTQGQVLTADGNGGQSWQDPTGGDPTEIIDDTAGEGDTDKVWSADKLDEEFGSVLNAIHGTDNHMAGIEYGGKILSKNVKNALLNLFTHVAYTDGNAQQYIDALKSAWGVTATISAINAVFTQGGAVIMEGDDLDTLKAYLVVNGVYTIDEYSFEDEVTEYTLSGTLSEGESIITVTYKGKTTTFTVEVTSDLPSAYKKVEWIGTTGTQGIMFPGIIATTQAELEKYEFDIDFKFDQWHSTAATNIAASFSSYGGCWIGYNNNVGNIAMGTTSGMYFTDNQPTVRHQYHYSFANGSGTIVRDDEASIARAFSSPTYSAVFALFGSTVKYEGGSTYFNDEFYFIGKLYGFTMTYEGEPLLELVPCYRKSDGEIGLYDMVGGTFYTNNGSGTFTKGDDV